MFADVSKPPKPLPTASLKTIRPGISLLPPLTRRGHGPGLVLLCSDSERPSRIEDGVPSPLMKWSEEGYAVVEIQLRALGEGNALREALEALNECQGCEPKGKLGLVAYDAGVWNQLASEIKNHTDIVGAVVYAADSERASLASSPIPVLHHLGGSPSARPPERSSSLTQYAYTKPHGFAVPFHTGFHYSTEAVSHTRSLTFLKPLVGGPYFDLEIIWDEHTYYEFADRSVEHTMSTMVQEPYVNHVPTMTGGIGRENLTGFYRGHFIFNNSADTNLELISRTVGIDRIIDEFIFSFTHDLEIDWMLPGIPPTGLKVEVPFTSVVNIRGDRLYHEHIAWDQASVLRQLGLLPEYLPYPYPVKDEAGNTSAKKYEYQLPVAGSRISDKLRDRDSVPSNEMFGMKMRERVDG